MDIDIRVEHGRAEFWAERIRRQLDYKLSGLEHRVETLEVVLTKRAQSGDGFECRMLATLTNGEERHALTRGSFPQICVADAAARLGREITRTVTLSPTRLRVPA